MRKEFYRRIKAILTTEMNANIVLKTVMTVLI